MAAVFLLPLLLFSTLSASAEAGYIGVNYGQVANNLPPASKVVQLLKAQGLDRVKLYDADPAVLTALANTNISVTVALPNELLSGVAARPSSAIAWVRSNVAAYHPTTRISAIAAGNEVFVANLTAQLVPAMSNLYAALSSLGLANDIKISSPIALSALRVSYPPSAGAFRPDLASAAVRPMLDFLRRTGSPLMINAYPFFAYAASSGKVPLDYALFRPNAGVSDPGNGLRYSNLFDAQVDAVFAAMSAVGYDDVAITVTETGWPSKGDEDEPGAGAANAAAYNGGLVRHVLSGAGTPLRPKAQLEVYLFALFNENEKPGPTSERNYGLFYPSEEKVYDIPLTADGVRREQKPTDGGGGSGTGSGVGVGMSPTANGVAQTWCVARGDAGKAKLQAALDYACGEGGADCRPIQPGAVCYNPNTLESHASFAFNSYYQKMGRGAGTCYFGGAASVVTRPSDAGKCGVASGHLSAATAANVSPPATGAVEEMGKEGEASKATADGVGSWLIWSIVLLWTSFSLLCVV